MWQQVLQLMMTIRVETCTYPCNLNLVPCGNKSCSWWWNTVRFSFFVRRNWKRNYSRITLWLFSQVWYKRYSRASSCQVSRGFPLCNDHADTKNPLFRKQLMHFNVHIAFCYFHIWFILMVNCNIKHSSRSSHHEMFS